MAKKILSPIEFQNFFNDVTSGIMEVEGAPVNLMDAFRKYDLQIPDLSDKYNEEYLKLLNTDFKEAQSTDAPQWHCEVCAVCALCILCGELNAAAGAGSVSGIFGIFNQTAASQS